MHTPQAKADGSAANGEMLTDRILIVNDDVELRSTLMSYLEKQSIRVLSASGRIEMLRQFTMREPSLVLLDPNVEKNHGLDLLREIRSRSDVPVIIATGQDRDEIDCVIGLELGADDYITKPFGSRELLARVRAVLRRSNGSFTAPEKDQRSGYRFAGWELNLRERRLLDSKGTQVPLTKGEYSLLTAFLAAPGRPLTREHLVRVTRVHEDVFDRSIDVQVLRLRRKLAADANVAVAIQTERGIGYRFTLTSEKF